MRHLDTDALAAFVAVFDHGGFTAAGERIGKTQAAVSLMVGRLEARVGRKLLERSRKGVSLTEHGERLIGYARRIQILEDEALLALQGETEASRIRIGMPDDYLETIGCVLMQVFSTRHPHLQVEIICDFSNRLEALLADGSIDLAIVTRADDRDSGDLLRSEAQLWCAAPEFFPEKGGVLPLSLFAGTCRARPKILDALDKAGMPWRLVSSSSHLPGVLHPVRTGQALTVLPASVVPHGWRILGEAEHLPLLPSLDLALMVPENALLSARRLAQCVREHFSQPASTSDQAASRSAVAL